MIEKTPLDSWIGSKIGVGKPLAGLTAETLVNYQLGKMRETIEYARRNSAFYRSHFSSLPGTTMSIDDLAHLRFTTAEDIQRGPYAFLCVPQGDIARIVTLHSSGTTGPSKRLFFTAEDLELTIDFFCHGMSTLVHSGQKVLILLPGNKPDSVGDLLSRALKRLDVEGLIHGPVLDVEKAVADILRHEIDCLVGIPVQVLEIVRSRAASAIEPGMIKSVLLSTDHVPESITREVGRRWNCPVFNHYGMTEMGLGGGVDCRAFAGYHLREADLYIEVVDPETGKIKEGGQVGEVVFTTLTRKGMPLIRYRTGDMGRFIQRACPCGSVLRLMEPVRGRWRDVARLGCGISVGLHEMDEVLFALPWLLDFRPVLSTGHGGREHLEITVYARAREDVDEAEVLDALMKIPELNVAFAGGFLRLAAVRFCEEGWSSTGLAKRRFIDHRPQTQAGISAAAMFLVSRHN